MRYPNAIPVAAEGDTSVNQSMADCARVLADLGTDRSKGITGFVRHDRLIEQLPSNQSIAAGDHCRLIEQLRHGVAVGSRNRSANS